MTEQAEHNYQPPVSTLLTIGDNDNLWSDPQEWPDYPTLYDLTETDIPELIRLATEIERWDLENVHDADELEYFYPCILACQSLTQFQAIEALEPLLNCVNTMEADGNTTEYDWFTEGLPRVIGGMPAAAIPILSVFLNDSSRQLYVRSVVAHRMVYIAKAHPEACADVIAVFTELLSQSTGFNATVNGFAIAHLIDLKLPETLPIIRTAFINNRVDLSVIDYSYVQEKLGLKAPDPRRNAEIDRRLNAFSRLMSGDRSPVDDTDQDADYDDLVSLPPGTIGKPGSKAASHHKERKQEKARRKQGRQQRKKGKKR